MDEAANLAAMNEALCLVAAAVGPRVLVLALVTAFLVEAAKRLPALAPETGRRAWLPLASVACGLAGGILMVEVSPWGAISGALAGCVASWGFDAVRGVLGVLGGFLRPFSGLGILLVLGAGAALSIGA